MSLVGYGRISTAEGRQVLDRQLDALHAAGCERVFEDHASGAAPDRPNLAACLDYLRRGDVLVVLDLDRHGTGRTYSMWEGYPKRESTSAVRTWLAGRNISMEVIHTSGHASVADLKRQEHSA